jgi:hypothetical protein
MIQTIPRPSAAHLPHVTVLSLPGVDPSLSRVVRTVVSALRQRLQSSSDAFF